MAMLFARVDDRLIHGQVVEGWLRFLPVKLLVAVSDSAASDPVQKTLMGMAVPEPVRLEVLSVADAANLLKNIGPAQDPAMVLLSCPKDALLLVKAGVELLALNLGGLHRKEFVHQISPAVSFNEEDLQSLRELSALGVELFAQSIPSEKRESVNLESVRVK